MSAPEEDFELLISTEDYLRLQSKCHELQEAQQNLNKQNRQMSLKIFDLKEQNADLHKKIAQLTDNTKYLSQKGIEMSQTLMDLELESNTLKTSMVQTQKQMAIKYKESLASLKQVQTKLLDMIKQNTKIKDELRQKSCDLQKIKNIQKCSRHIQFSPTLIQKTTSTVLTQQDLQAQSKNKKQLEANCSSFKNQIQDLTAQIQKERGNIKQFQENVKKLSQNLTVSKSQNDCLENKLISQFQKQQKLEHQLAKVVQQLDEANKKYKDLIEQKKMLERKLADIKDHVNKANTDLSAMIAQSQMLNSEKQMIKKDLEDNSKKVSNFENQNIELKDKIKITQSQVQKITITLQEKNAQCEALSKQIKVAENKINEQKQKVKQSTQKSNTLMKQLAKIKESLGQKQKMARQMIAKLDQTTEQVNQQKQRCSNMEKQLQEYQNSEQQLRSQIATLAKQVSDYRQIAEQNKALASNSQAIIYSLKDQNTLLTNRIEQIEGEKSKISNQLKETKNRMQERINQTAEQKRRVIQQSCKIKLQLESALLSLRQKQSDAKGLQAQKKRLQEDNAIKSIFITQLKQKTEALQTEKMLIVQQSNKNIAELKYEILKVNQSKQTMEKQYEDIILSMDLEKQGMNKSKSKDKPQRDQLKEVKSLIEEYFTNLALNLYEVGNLDPQDIRGILRQQQEIVKQYVSDVMGPFIQQKKPPMHHHPRSTH